MASASADETTPLTLERLSDVSPVSVRHGFIQKVYGILCTQLLVTFVVATFVTIHGQALARQNPSLASALLLISLVVSLGMMFIFTCRPELLRSSPTNYIILAVFTGAKAVMIGLICASFTQESVLLALGIAVLVTFSLTLFACQTKYDFSGMGPYLCVGGAVLASLGLFMWIGGMIGLGGSPAFQTVHLLYAAGGALLFACYIVLETQRVVGGKQSREFGIDDYAPAAISLYTNVIQFFLFLLRLFGERK